MALERRHQFGLSGFSSDGSEASEHFYPCNFLPDPFSNGGTLVRTMSWPKVGLYISSSGPTAPPEWTWGHGTYCWMAYYSADGTVPPVSLINPYSGNCVLRSMLTPAVYPSPSVPGSYTVLLTSDSEGVQSKRMHKPTDPELTAKLITGFYVNDYYWTPAAFPHLEIHGSSNDYTIWEKHT